MVDKLVNGELVSKLTETNEQITRKIYERIQDELMHRYMNEEKNNKNSTPSKESCTESILLWSYFLMILRYTWHQDINHNNRYETNTQLKRVGVISKGICCSSGSSLDLRTSRSWPKDNSLLSFGSVTIILLFFITFTFSWIYFLGFLFGLNFKPLARY